MSVAIVSIVSFAETPVTIHSYGNSDLPEDIQFMSSYDTITVLVDGTNYVNKKIDSIDINFVPSNKDTPEGIQVTINVRLHVEGKYCDFIFWIKSKTRPHLNEYDVAMDISSNQYTVDGMIADYMKAHNQKCVVLAQVKKVEKKNPSKKG